MNKLKNRKKLGKFSIEVVKTIKRVVWEDGYGTYIIKDGKRWPVRKTPTGRYQLK